MNYKKILTSSIILVLIAALATSLNVGVTTVKAQQQGPASDVIIFEQHPVETAALALEAGDIDYYIFGMTPADARPLVGNPDVTLSAAPSGLVSFCLNPAPAPEGEFNPLSNKDFRFALNYLVDRDYVLTQIYEGFAASMVCFLSSYDPDFVTIYDIIAKYDFKYDPVLGDNIITDVMTSEGATKVEGKWMYNGQPVTLKFVIRIEDERREIGDTLASALEDVGLTVDRIYMTFGQAIPTIYGTDPVDFEWHLYTEGWGKDVLDKYDYGTINQYGAPWYGYMPGWQEAGFWQYENATLDELGQRIFTGDFQNKEERDQLYRQMSEMVIQESCRIWVATKLEIMPYNNYVSGITQDLGVGLRCLWNAREAYVPGRDPAELRIGHLWVHSDGSAWNPVGGHNDVYSVDQWHLVADAFTKRHPFSGLPIPVRCDYTVTTAGPDGTLTVPADASMYNVDENRWDTVGSGVTATSKVVFDKSKYVGTNWHNGVPITWADILFPITNAYELAYDPDRSTIEGATASLIQTQLEPFKGYKIVGNTFEVYVDYWHFDENYIADYCDVLAQDPPMTAHYPWEILAAMDIVVFEDNDAMYSESASDSFGVPWLSVNLPVHAALVNGALDRMDFADYESLVTMGGTVYSSASEMADRIAEHHSWYSTYNHMVISDGPYYMEIFDAAGQFAQYRAFRDPTYPFSAGDWFYGLPEPPEIARVGIPTVVPGGTANFIVDVNGLPPLGVKYLIKDPTTGELVAIGDAEGLTTTRFRITLSSAFTKTLEPTLYELTVAAYSEQVAFVASSKQFFDVFNTLPLEDAFKDATQSATDQLTEIFDSRSQQLEESFTDVSLALTSAFEVATESLSASFDSATETLTQAVTQTNNAIQQLGTSLSTQMTSNQNAMTQSVNSIAAMQNTLMLIVAAVIVLSIINLVLIAIVILRRK